MDLTALANGPPEPPLRQGVGFHVRCEGMTLEHEPLCAQGDRAATQILSYSGALQSAQALDAPT
jgi:hypothetical protein